MRHNEGPAFRLTNAEDAYAAEGFVDRRRRMLVITVVTALVVALGGLGAAQFVKSPGEHAAEADAPPHSLITAEVESRRLVDTVVLRGRVTAAQSVDVTAQGAGKSLEDSGGSAVVTAVRVKTGDALAAGQVLVEISGRPVFVLPGAVPAYRDLKPGAEGKDVAQLQQALSAVGLNTGADRSGSYGVGTRDAVAALYQRIGYSAPQAQGSDDGKTETPPDPAKSGAMVPASEVVFLGAFPGRVDSVNAQVGKPAAEKVLGISSGALVIRGALAPHEKGLVRPDMQVKVLSEVTGLEAAAKVTSVADAPSDPNAANGDGGEAKSGSGARTYEMVATPTQPLNAKLAGQDVRLTVEAAASAGPVLVVPLSAVSAGADGRTVVTVVEPNGAKRRVEVRPGTTGDGYVQVTPVANARLGAGERVMIGVAGGPAGAAATAGADK
ncbi:peptidoglycan-binding protein [Streptodolium elevatio]